MKNELRDGTEFDEENVQQSYAFRFAASFSCIVKTKNIAILISGVEMFYKLKCWSHVGDPFKFCTSLCWLIDKLIHASASFVVPTLEIYCLYAFIFLPATEKKQRLEI